EMLHGLLKQQDGAHNEIAAATAEAEIFLKQNSLDKLDSQLRASLSAVLIERDTSKKGILELIEFLRANNSNRPDAQHQQWLKVLDERRLSIEEISARLLIESPIQADVVQ
ncbi:MAG TPA: hypothetical protein PLK61_12520, partial [Nitrosomonas sp.]|nr:hypothetical protein [Nitrosomonas sp.]